MLKHITPFSTATEWASQCSPTKILLRADAAVSVAVPVLVNPHVTQQAVQAAELLAAPVAQLARLVAVVGHQMAGQTEPPHQD